MNGEDVERFVGRSVKRVEDARLVAGRGRYVADMEFPRQLHAAFVRSQAARGALRTVDASIARQAEGVVAVYTADDLHPLAHAYWTTATGPNVKGPVPRTFATDDVRYVGEPIAIVVATSRYLAEDAADLVIVDIDAETPVVTIDQAVSSEILVHPELGSNQAGDAVTLETQEFDRAIAGAAHVFTETFDQHRYVCAPLECRAINAWWDPLAERMEVIVASQGAHEVRASVARLIGAPEDDVHVVMPDVGGSFGQKAVIAREEGATVLAARKLGRAVRWIEDRAENLIAGGHSREASITTTFAVDEDGRILAIRADHVENVGAYPKRGNGMPGAIAGLMYPGGYKIPHLSYRGRALYSNTGGRCAYRGPWMMETVAREQMVDVVAGRLGLDPLELRRRNVLHQEDLPFTTASNLVYETISPAETLEQAVQMISYEEFREEQRAAREHGRYLGIGLAMYVEPQSGAGILATEGVRLRVEPSGRVTAFVSSGSHGQSNETTALQVIADELGVHMDELTFVQGDTASTPYGPGTSSSRSAALISGAAMIAARALREKILHIGSMMLEADERDVQFLDGAVSVVGVPSVGIPLRELARFSYHGSMLARDGADLSLEVTSRYRAPAVMFSNACHAVTVETDVVTGVVTILRYVVSEDCGNMINPMVVEGQVAGGVAQGIGGVLYEHFHYDDQGNPLTTTFLDYHLPTATEIPDFEIGHVVTPSGTPGGYKGMGEGGAICAPPALLNAVRDSLRPFNAQIRVQPLTPEAVVNAITGAR